MSDDDVNLDSNISTEIELTSNIYTSIDGNSSITITVGLTSWYDLVEE